MAGCSSLWWDAARDQGRRWLVVAVCGGMLPEIKVGVAGCSSLWLVSCRMLLEIKVGVVGCSSLLLVLIDSPP